MNFLPDRSTYPEAPLRGDGLKGEIQGSRSVLETSFEAADAAPQDEVEGGIALGPIALHCKVTGGITLLPASPHPEAPQRSGGLEGETQGLL
ncbi:hypothetical protein G3T14_15025 [Methylobacterium sp. BTF04]|uniref:hypothetical protein n=1 Tax=Methylobacterium sp. BTF04 TaxID=2708300 RepID=UPI0013D6D0F0|nr:hypothetical protein [Methylobacterium sp. BTF04]NEU13435.1 hypothetical protein [Methylobacterium sp. BTF04]